VPDILGPFFYSSFFLGRGGTFVKRPHVFVFRLFSGAVPPVAAPLALRARLFFYGGFTRAIFSLWARERFYLAFGNKQRETDKESARAPTQRSIGEAGSAMKIFLFIECAR
jgi:hypothetical protein